jgi:hypothetical protein
MMAQTTRPALFGPVFVVSVFLRRGGFDGEWWKVVEGGGREERMHCCEWGW